MQQWDDWLGQASQDAKASDKNMFLLIKYNYTEAMVFTDEELFGNIDPIFIWDGQYFVYILKDVLELDDEVFFN